MPPKKTKEKEETYIYCIINRLAPDRTEYKKYGIELIPHRVMVKIPVPEEEVEVLMKKNIDGTESDQGDIVVLSLDGLMAVAEKLADNIDQLHNAYVERMRKGDYYGNRNQRN